MLLTAALTLSLAGCGTTQESQDEDPKNQETIQAESNQETLETEQPSDLMEEEDPALTEEPVLEDQTPITEVNPAPSAEEKDQAQNLPADPAVKPEGGNTPANPAEKPQSQQVQKPVEQQPPVQQAPVEAPSESSVDLTAFYDSLAADSNWPAMTAIEGEVQDTFYAGLSDISTQQCSVHTAMISAVVAEVALVEVTDEADVQKVKDIFQARIDYQVGDDENPGAAMYPASIEGWKNNSRIVSNGKYVMLVVYEGADDVVTAFNALFA